MNKAPPALSDALGRIQQANEDYSNLLNEMNKFMYNYVKGMIRGIDRKSKNFVLQLRHPKDSYVKGRPRVLVAQIVENLRTALDYMIYEISVLNEPNLNERVPQFLIAQSKSDFERQAQKRLRYLTEEQKYFVECIQPYHGNEVLAILGELAIRGKHRRLVSVQDMTGLDIYFAEIEKAKEYHDCFMYPLEEGNVLFAKPKNKVTFLLMEKYDTENILKAMIDHTAEVVQASYCFFGERPLNLTIIRE